jgi:hypothetical protein
MMVKKVTLSVLGAAALVLAARLLVRSPAPPHPATALVTPREAAPAAPPAAADPAFPTAAQAVAYYGAVVGGERRALEVVTRSLDRVGTGGADRARLEGLREGYLARLRRHQEKLALARQGQH